MKKTLFIILLFANVFFANAFTRMSDYRWRNDNGNETVATWKTTPNTAIQINSFQALRLRIAVVEYSGYTATPAVSTLLEYSENGGAWQSVGSPMSKFAYVNSVNVASGTNTTQQLSFGPSFSGGKFQSDGTNIPFNTSSGASCEHEFCIQPTSLLSPSSTYTFRIPNMTSSNPPYPELTTAAILCATPIAYTVDGGGNGCESLGLEVALDGSQAGMNYQLKLDGNPIGNEVPGTGGALSFGLQTVSGNYTVDALNNTNGCNIAVAMNGSAIVNLAPFSEGGDLTGGNVICTNTEGGLLTLTGNVGDIINWESAVSPFTVWTTIANATADYNPGILTETTKFRAVSQNGNCNPAASTETTVIVITPTVVPTGTALQVYAGTTATLADLAVNGFGIKWYTAASNGTELAATEILTDNETYYASQTFNGCESTDRLAVSVRKISEVSQSFCDGALVDDLITTPSPDQTVQWFYDAAGTSPVSEGTSLSDGTYYVAQRIPSVVSTFAGSGTAGTLNATGTAAQFNKPRGVVTDSQGNIFVTDYSNSRIRKITPAGVVTTFAGGTGLYTDGTGTAAGFNQPHGITIDGSDNLYIGDTGNSRIRKITAAAVVSTIAGQSLQGDTDGNGSAAQFSNPSGVTADLAGTIYVADVTNYRIRKITPTGDVTTFAGSTNGFNDAQGTASQFSFAYDVTADSAGNIYAADTNNHVIRKITPAGDVTTFAGSTSGYADGVGTAAMFSSPRGIAVDAADNIYVTDTNNRRIRKITPSGVVTTVAGSGIAGSADGNGDVAEFGIAWGLTVDDAGDIYVADTNNNKIRKIVQGSSYSNLVPVSVVINPLPVLDAQPNVTACGSYTLPPLTSGNYFTETNGGGTALFNDDVIIASQTLYVYAESGTTPNCTAQNSFDVTIIPVTNNEITLSACDSYTWPVDSQVYTTSGTYTSGLGCHTEILNLTINPLPDNTVTQLGDTLTVSETGAAYQWNVCETNGTFTPIVGATDQSYLATGVGSYSVEVTKNGCSTTSGCYEITVLGNPEFGFNSKVTVHPNPSHDVFNITTDSHSTLIVFDLIGKVIHTQDINPGISKLDLSQYPSGMYLMKMTDSNNQVQTVKLVKE